MYRRAYKKEVYDYAYYKFLWGDCAVNRDPLLRYSTAPSWNWETAHGIFITVSLFSVYFLLQREDITIAYKNAADILPEDIINLIRNYVEGEAIYIPKAEKHTKWGENSGIRNEYQNRNMNIAEEHKNGASVAQLSEKYCLCEDSIRKILKKYK